MMRLSLTDKHGASSDKMLKQAYENIGDYYFDRQLWSQALQYFVLANVVAKQIPCLYALEDFAHLARFATDPEFLPDGQGGADGEGGGGAPANASLLLEEGSPLLITVGERLASVGLADEAVQAFLRGNDVKAAIDCCVLLNQVCETRAGICDCGVLWNQWDQAVCSVCVTAAAICRVCRA